MIIKVLLCVEETATLMLVMPCIDAVAPCGGTVASMNTWLASFH